MLHFAHSFISEHITINSCYYLLPLCIAWVKTKKTYCRANNIRMENNEFEKFCIKNRTCYYFDDIIKFEDFDFDNILIDGKAHKNILIYDIS